MFTMGALRLVSMLVVVMAASDAMAQSADSGSTSSSGAAASSGSRSSAIGGGSANSATRSQQTNQQGVTANTNTGVTLNQQSYGGGSSSNYQGYGGGTSNYNRNDGDVTVRNVPQVYAPNVQGGNPCALGASVGVSWIGAGVAGGASWVDAECARRMQVALLHNAGYPQAARELACRDRETYIAFKLVNQPCVFNPAYEPAGAVPPAQPPVAPAPAPLVTSTPVIKDRTNLPRCDARKGINDNCYS